MVEVLELNSGLEVDVDSATRIVDVVTRTVELMEVVEVEIVDVCFVVVVVVSLESTSVG